MTKGLPSAATYTRFIDERFDRFIAGPALLLLAFSALYDVGLANTALAVLLVATLILAPLHGDRLVRDPLLWLTLGFLCWVLLSATLHAQVRPDWSYTIWNTAGDWLLTPLLGSFVVAFWLARHRRLLPWLLVLMVAGYLFRIGERISMVQLEQLVQGTDRATFGDAATNFGTWSLLVLLALVAIFQFLLHIKRRSIRMLAAVLWVVAVLVAVSGLILSQARGAWLTALMVFPVTLYLFLRERAPRRNPGELLAAAFGLVIVLLILVSVIFGTVLERRLDDHRETIVQILSGEVHDLPSDSPGYRVRMYFEAVETWWQRPLLGYGPGASEIALAESEDSGIRRFRDTHNSYLVILTEFGLFGLVALGAFVLVLIERVRRAHRAGWLCTPCASLLLGAALALAVTQLFQYSLHSYRGPFVVALLCGMAWAYRFTDMQLSASTPESGQNGT